MKQGWKPTQEVLSAISDSQVAGLRLFLSLCAILATYLNSSDSVLFLSAAYATLAVYTLYSASIVYAGQHLQTFSSRVNASLVAADVAVYSALIFLSGGANSIFFFFYFFVILVACSRLGARAGLLVTFAATGTLLLQAYFNHVEAGEWNRALMRSVILIALGYVLTYWAGAEHALRRKMDLLRDVSLTSNPRFGVNRTASHLMSRVLEFFKADTCVLLDYSGDADDYHLRYATANTPDAGAEILEPPEHIRNVLQGVMHAGVAVYASDGHASGHRPAYITWEPISQAGPESRELGEAVAVVAEWLGSQSFIAAPLRHHEWLKGYLFVGTVRSSAYRMEDARFLLHLADQVTPVLEHIRLVDRMASGAAEEERRRIARSVHDRIIQPYIGLHMGLRGLRQIVRSALQSGGAGAGQGVRSQQAMASLDYLVDMAREGVEELREYVYDLRKSGEQGDILLNSLLRYAAKFETVTGIRVSVVSRLDGEPINDRLAGELFQMATEALSNVQRHTTATAVHLSLEQSSKGGIAVRIANKASDEKTPHAFLPRSIAERAESLGGHTQVTQNDGRTVVNIEIPL
jgi:signal transduction histidine kinase